MSNLDNYKAEIDDWADMWDEMQSKEMHPKIQPTEMSPFAADLLGDFDEGPTDGGEANESEPEIIQEIAEEESVPNPVRVDTAGQDQQQPEPVWVSEKLLPEIEELKNKLFKLENDLARMGQGEEVVLNPIENDGKDLMEKIETIRKNIEAVSSQLGIKNEPSAFRK